MSSGTSTPTRPPAPGASRPDPSDPRSQRRARASRLLAAVVAVLVVVGAFLGTRAALAHDSDPNRPVPQSSTMEKTLGVRFSRVAVVGDGGLVTLSYVVLDVEKASRFQSDTKHPPTLRSEARDESTNRVSVMRQGHINRAGATYYFVYQNTGSALRSGEDVTIEYAGLRLEHVPVL